MMTPNVTLDVKGNFSFKKVMVVITPIEVIAARSRDARKSPAFLKLTENFLIPA
ncbi:MAG: hypothetical protein ACI9NQ_000403 [Paracoccaceae bacterium]|jgi:hypothetical protein